MADLNSFFWSELNKAGDRQPEEKSNSIFMICPNVNHSGGMERSASLRLNYSGRYAGRFKCYGCQWKGHWNDIADVLKLQKLNAASHVDKEEEIINNSTYEDIMGCKKSVNESSLPAVKEREADWFADTDWRGIKGSTLCSINSLLVIEEYGYCKLRIPAFLKGKRVGHITASLIKPTNKNFPSYLESKHRISNTPWSYVIPLFYDRAKNQLKKNNGTLFIVEGPRDALRLIENGINAIALLGTEKVSPKKINKIVSLNANRYVIMMDGDSAGDKASDKLQEELSKKYATFSVVNLPDGVDPFDLPHKTIKKLKKAYC